MQGLMPAGPGPAERSDLSCRHRFDRVCVLPTRQAWLAFYEEDYARPIRDRVDFSLVWQRGGEVVGFSSADRIDFGKRPSCTSTLSRPD